MRVRFTPVQWNRWLDRLNGTQPHPHSAHLGEGIQHFRAALAKVDRRAKLV
jgi:hypothetical protein